MEQLESGGGGGGDQQMPSTQSLGMMRVAKIKNYTPAEIQITAEQLLRESQAYRMDDYKPPRHRLQDTEELEDYKYRMRRDLEDSLRRQRHHMGTWIKYAEWEASIGEFARARSVFERAIDVDFEHVQLWLKYAEMEMRNQFVNHARNVWERACKHMPRVDQFWFKYAYMEEMLGNVDRVRAIYNDWMSWEPTENAWNTYLKFEERQGDLEKCREILEKFIDVYPTVQSYIKAAKFEEYHRRRDSSRLFYERALAELGPKAFDETFFLAFTQFEIRFKEFERAKILYRYALDKLPKEKSNRLYQQYLEFEKQYGSREEMEEAVITKRRHYLEAELDKEPYNYDLWFDYTRLEEQSGEIEKAREVYERAIQKMPPQFEKRLWKRYIYLWINYAIFEETIANHAERANAIYEKIIKLIPHETFTFSKLWILYSQFLVRQKNLAKARKTFGQAIGRCPRQKIFKAYAQLEEKLACFENCRKINEKQIEVFPENSQAWIEYAEFETQLEETDRARGIYELAITRPNLDMPENVWKSFIDLEIALTEYDKVRSLYQRLLQKSKHVKVWISYGKFEQENAQDAQKAREVFQQAYMHFKANEPELKEERLLILENWLKLEQSGIGSKQQLEVVQAKLPKRVKKRRKVKVVDQSTGEELNDDAGWEEYYDYMFPDDQEQKKSLKILEMAHKWKKESAAAGNNKAT